MSRDPRRLFKQPRRPRQWTPGARLLVGTLIVVIALVLAAGTVVALSEFPPGKPADPWAAEGAIFGIGAFVLAVLATIIATIAFINSSEKPALRIEPSYPGRDETLSPVRGSGYVKTDAYREVRDWSLSLTIYNDGPIAARFVAIHVIFGPGLHIYSAADAEWLKPWHSGLTLLTETNEVFWEGGADAVIHPSWPYPAPQLGPTQLRLAGAGPQSQRSFHFEVEVVADDVPPFRSTHNIRVSRDK